MQYQYRMYYISLLPLSQWSGNVKEKIIMKAENQIRDTRNDSDDKLIKVLEHFLSLHETDEIFTMINDNCFDVSDVVEMLENYENPERKPTGLSVFACTEIGKSLPILNF